MSESAPSTAAAPGIPDTGLINAWNRYCAAARAADHARYAAAVAQMLHWLCLVESSMWDARNHDKRRAADREGSCVPGLRWAGAEDVHQLVSSPSAPMTSGCGIRIDTDRVETHAFFASLWLPIPESSSPRPPDPAWAQNREVYQDKLVGHSVKNSIRGALCFLSRQGCLPDGFAQYVFTIKPTFVNPWRGAA